MDDDGDVIMPIRGRHGSTDKVHMSINQAHDPADDLGCRIVEALSPSAAGLDEIFDERGDPEDEQDQGEDPDHRHPAHHA